MSGMLLQVYHEIVENAAFGTVMASDAIIRFLKLEQSFERHTHKRPQGHPLGRLLRLNLTITALAGQARTSCASATPTSLPCRSN